MEPTRKQRLVAAKQQQDERNQGVIKTRIKQAVDGKSKRPVGLTQDQKMLCALRKVLVAVSERSEDNQRFFLSGETMRVDERSSSPGAKEGDPGTYHAKGSFRLGVIHPGKGGVTYKQAAFDIHFRDTIDDRGFSDVEYDDNTTVDIAPGPSS